MKISFPRLPIFQPLPEATASAMRSRSKRLANCCAKKAFLQAHQPGTLLAAALRFCREQTEPKRVVTLACDTGNKYLSKLYNDFWLEDQGFIEREAHDDLRDLVGRPHGERATITVGPTDNSDHRTQSTTQRRVFPIAGDGRGQAGWGCDGGCHYPVSFLANRS